MQSCAIVKRLLNPQQGMYKVLLTGLARKEAEHIEPRVKATPDLVTSSCHEV